MISDIAIIFIYVGKINKILTTLKPLTGNEQYGHAALPSLSVSVGVTAGTADYLSIQNPWKYIANDVKTMCVQFST